MRFRLFCVCLVLWAALARPALSDVKEDGKTLVTSLLNALHKRSVDQATAVFSTKSASGMAWASQVKQGIPMLESYDFRDLEFGDWRTEEAAGSCLCAFKFTQVAKPKVRQSAYALWRVVFSREDGQLRIAALNANPAGTQGDPILDAATRILTGIQAPDVKPDEVARLWLAPVPRFTYAPIVQAMLSYAGTVLQNGTFPEPILKAALAVAELQADREVIAAVHQSRAYACAATERREEAVRAVEAGWKALGADASKFSRSAMRETGCVTAVVHGDYAEAVRMIDAAIELMDPEAHSVVDRIRMLGLKARALLLNRDARAALAVASSAVALSDENQILESRIAGRILRGECYAALGDHGQAAASMREGLALAPPDTNAVEYFRIPLVVELADEGRYAEALVELEKVRRVANLTGSDPALSYLASECRSSIINATGDMSRWLAVSAFQPKTGPDGRPAIDFGTPIPPPLRLQFRTLFQNVEGVAAGRYLETDRYLWPRFADLSREREKLSRELDGLVVSGDHPVQPGRDALKEIVYFGPDLPPISPASAITDGRLTKAFLWIRLLARLDRKADALEVASQTLARARKFLSDRVTKESLISLGTALAAPATLAEAAHYLDEAENLPGSLRAGYDLRMARALIAEQKGDNAAAKVIYRQLVKDILSGRGGAGMVGLRISVLEQAEEPAYRLCRLLVSEGNAREALIAADEVRGRGLLDQIAAPVVLDDSALTPEQKQKVDSFDFDIRTAIERAVAANKQGPPAAFPFLLAGRFGTEISTLRIQRDLYRQGALISQLSRRSLEAPSLDTNGLAAFLRAGGERRVLLYYFAGDDGVLLFVARTDVVGKLEVSGRLLPLGYRSLNDRVIDFRQACSHRDGLVPGELDEKGKPTPAQTIDYAPLARSLYQDLVAPVRNELEGAGEAVVCVNGTLMNMPFAALISPQGRHFVEEFAITYTPSAAAELVLSGRRRLSFSLEALKQQPLIVGNPLIHEDARNLYNIESVPATAEQASSVAKRMGVTALVGAAATLQAVRDRLPEASLIHFAGHGLFDTPAEYSALVMAPGATDMGLLDAGSILKMRLKAQMAVLCGCDTARGDLRRSEGFTGLPWSLLAAGVPVVMATQWEARDTNAAIFMDEFYRRLLAPGGKAAPSLCLAQTMRQVLTNGLNRHPYYWALYSLIGDAQ